MQLIKDTTFLIHELATKYHEQAAQNLSSHQLANFRKSPLLYQRKRLGLVPDVDRPAYKLGRAAHTLILEGQQQFHEEYAIGGPINPNTGKAYGASTKKFSDWAEDQGKPVLTNEQFDLLREMERGVIRHDLATSLLIEGVAEGVVRTKYCGLSCQTRMDWLNPNHGLVDLKTTDDLQWFEADSRRYGYVHQMAFYRAVLEQAIGTQVPVHLIGIEKKEPYRCGVWQLSNEVLGMAQLENEDAIEQLKRCEVSGLWTTGYEECRVFESI